MNPAAKFQALPAQSSSPEKASPLSSFLPGCLLFVLALIAFGPAVRNGFIDFDDPDYVTQNAQVQQGLTGEGIRWAFSTHYAANWHPLTWISHMVDWSLYESDPSGHHASSILIHALSAVLLFLFLRNAKQAAEPAFVVALLFALHPLRVESVAWIAERKDVLCVFFWLLSLLTYSHYAQANPRQRRAHWRYYFATLFLIGLGSLAKGMIVTAPFLLLVIDFWPLERWREVGWRKLVLEKVPFFILVGAVSFVTWLAQKEGGAMAGTSFGFRIGNALLAYLRYLGKLLVPIHLSPFYPPVKIIFWVSLLAAVILIAATVCVYSARVQKPCLLAGWLWFLGTLVPVIGIVQVGDQSMADRYTYFPSIGFWIAVVCGLHASEQARNILARWGRPLLVVLTFLLIGVTWSYLGKWHDTEKLFRHALKVTRNNYVAENGLGAAAEKKRDYPEAKVHYREALRIKPDYADAWNNLGVVADRQGDVQEAVKLFREAIHWKPGYASAWNNLGMALGKEGLTDAAISAHRRAIALNSHFADAHDSLGLLLARKGSSEDAVQEFRTAIRFQPASADAHNNLAVALDNSGKTDLAILEYQQALALRPIYPRAHFNLGVALARAGRLDQAIAEFSTALLQKPDYVEAQKNLDALNKLRTASPPR